MSIFLLAMTLIWFLVFLCADVYLTNNTTLERFPIMAASMLWPVAVVVALFRIATAGRSGECSGERK